MDPELSTDATINKRPEKLTQIDLLYLNIVFIHRLSRTRVKDVNVVEELLTQKPNLKIE